ncbi:hypothetical protein [Commensalibacter communis]|uniref:hypothetical protein n=1 Tax=Commensalibacter communis TaxID=2972786 RepID=UPI00232E5CD6|nr:hypothetical protein [Commensalibacter communis]
MDTKYKIWLIGISFFIIVLIKLSLVGYAIYSIYALYHLAQTTGITTADWIWYGIAIFLGLGGCIFNSK